MINKFTSGKPIRKVHGRIGNGRSPPQASTATLGTATLRTLAPLRRCRCRVPDRARDATELR